jgi:hypothetical protein
MGRWLILMGLLCYLTGAATAEPEWQRVGNWTDLCTTMLGHDTVEVKYDQNNILYPGIGLPEPSIDFILLLLYPQNQSQALLRNAQGDLVPAEREPRPYLYLHGSAVETEAGVTFHVLRMKKPDGINLSYDGSELLQYEAGSEFNAYLSGRSELRPIWDNLMLVLEERLK